MLGDSTKKGAEMDIVGSIKYRFRKIAVRVQYPSNRIPVVLMYDEDEKKWTSVMPEIVRVRAIKNANTYRKLI